MAPGSVVTFVDDGGKAHNALVIHAWQTSLNIAHVGEGEDSCGKNIVRQTSVPFYAAGMKGFYIVLKAGSRLSAGTEKQEEPERQPNLPEEKPDPEEEADIDGMGPLRKGVKETLK